MDTVGIFDYFMKEPVRFGFNVHLQERGLLFVLTLSLFSCTAFRSLRQKYIARFFALSYVFMFYFCYSF